MKKNKIEAVIKLYGFSRSAGAGMIRNKITPLIKDLGLSGKILATIVDSSNELCDGNGYHAPGDCPLYIEICSSDEELARVIDEKLTESGVKIQIYEIIYNVFSKIPVIS